MIEEITMEQLEEIRTRTNCMPVNEAQRYLAGLSCELQERYGRYILQRAVELLGAMSRADERVQSEGDAESH